MSGTTARPADLGPTPVRVGVHTVGVWQYGDPTGRPVFAFHGVPASGAGFAWADATAVAHGLRLLAPDRPGVGTSSRSADWRVCDYPARVEALADVLDIDTFAVWGYSGGGPYAAACAVQSARVAAAAICAGMGQICDGWARIDDFEKTDAQLLRLVSTRTWQARAMLTVAARSARLSPAGAIKSFAKQLSTTDRLVLDQLGQPRDVMRLFTEAFTNGSHGVVADYAALAKPWGLDLTPPSRPLSVWHGDDDPMVPIDHSRVLADRLGVDVNVWSGEGHLATITHVGEVMQWISTHLLARP